MYVPSDNLELSKCVFGDEGSKVKVGAVFIHLIIEYFRFDHRGLSKLEVTHQIKIIFYGRMLFNE